LIRTHHFSVLFGIKLAGKFRGINQVTKEQAELPSFRVGRRCSRERCDLRGLLSLGSRQLGCLSRLRGNCLSACCVPRPNETSIIFIDHRLCEKQFVLQVVEVVVIEVEASFQRTIGHTSLTFQ
jgi:hypothetical protein